MSIDMKCDHCENYISEESTVYAVWREDALVRHYCDAECLGAGISDALPTEKGFRVQYTTTAKLQAGERTPGGCTLRLTKEEADVLCLVMDAIGGSPDWGHPRAAMAKVAVKLRELGAEKADATISGSIYLSKKG